MRTVSEALEFLRNSQGATVPHRVLERYGFDWWTMEHLIDLGMASKRELSKGFYYRFEPLKIKVITIIGGSTNSVYRRNLVISQKGTSSISGCMKDIEDKNRLWLALLNNNGVQSKAAREIGISRKRCDMLLRADRVTLNQIKASIRAI